MHPTPLDGIIVPIRGKEQRTQMAEQQRRVPNLEELGYSVNAKKENRKGGEQHLEEPSQTCCKRPSTQLSTREVRQ
jgi:hypothetical protein